MADIYGPNASALKLSRSRTYQLGHLSLIPSLKPFNGSTDGLIKQKSVTTSNTEAINTNHKMYDDVSRDNAVNVSFVENANVQFGNNVDTQRPLIFLPANSGLMRRI